MPIAPGQTILGEYHIISLIGQGGMGRVWLAEDLSVLQYGGRKVAIKELLHTDSDEAQERFRREALVCNILQSAQAANIVPFLTVKTFEDRPLLVSEYMPGGDLKQRIERSHPDMHAGAGPNMHAGAGGRMPLNQAIAVALSVLKALHGAHDHALSIIHRDVKPSNILFDARDEARLGDWGIAQISGHTDSPYLYPSPLYASPEDKPEWRYLTPAADIYSLGCVLFEMLTGKRFGPQPLGTRAGSLRADVPEWLDAVIAKAVTEHPADRFQSAPEMAQAIEQGQRDEQGAKAHAEARARAETAERARRAAEEQAQREATERSRAEAAARRKVEQERARQIAETETRRQTEEAERRRRQAEQWRPWLIAGAALIVLVIVLASVMRSCDIAKPSPTPTRVPLTATRAVAAPPTATPAKTAATPTTVATAPGARKTYAAPPAMTTDKAKGYTATIATTKGNIKLQLFADAAPITVNSFVFLAREGFYDGLKIMRADEGWLIQTGDPAGNATGSAGYTIPYEASGKPHVAGAVGMAHAADPNSGSSQFYIVKSDATWLDPPSQRFCVFAQVIEGMSVLNALTNSDAMQRVTIEEAAPTATAVPPTPTRVPPTATPRPPTATPRPPTATAVPPTVTLEPTTTAVPVPPTAAPTNFVSTPTSPQQSTRIPEKVTVSSIRASSTFPQQDPTGYWATNAVDGNTGTLWISASGDTAGAWLVFSFPRQVRVTSMRIYTLGGPDNGGRVRTGTLVFSTGTGQAFSLPDVRGWYTIPVDSVDTLDVKLAVGSVYGGRLFDDVIIPEVEFYGTSP